jgi:hypothetical protein
MSNGPTGDRRNRPKGPDPNGWGLVALWTALLTVNAGAKMRQLAGAIMRQMTSCEGARSGPFA